jgi:hypothetical protein
VSTRVCNSIASLLSFILFLGFALLTVNRRCEFFLGIVTSLSFFALSCALAEEVRREKRT